MSNVSDSAEVGGEPGFLRGWGWKPAAAMARPKSYSVRREVLKGPVTLERVRRNARVPVEYMEGWLNSRGAKGVDSPVATGRMSPAQIAHGVSHTVKSEGGAVHDARCRTAATIACMLANHQRGPDGPRPVELGPSSITLGFAEVDQDASHLLADPNLTCAPPILAQGHHRKHLVAPPAADLRGHPDERHDPYQARNAENRGIAGQRDGRLGRRRQGSGAGACAQLTQP